MVDAETATPQPEAPMAEDTSVPNPERSHSTAEVTIETGAPECSESTINNAEASGIVSDSCREKSLEFADELMEKGAKAIKDCDFAEATECFSRALEIRAAHYGELAPECVSAYYKYGSALLYKAQEEADPLAAMPKKDTESHQDFDKDGSVKNNENGDSYITSVNVEQDMKSKQQEAACGVCEEKNEEDEDEESDDLGEADEDDSDLDLAWKMLDLARAIAEKQSMDTMEKVDILSALAEVALEREDIETSLSDYLKALSILERLVEQDSRYIAELNFRICLCLEIGSKAQEAIPYCQKAISICKSRMQRLTDEVKSLTMPTSVSASSEADQDSADRVSDNTVSDKQVEIETLTGLSGELEKKLEDLQQLASNPRSILSDILGMTTSATVRGSESHKRPATASSSRIDTANSNGCFDTPTVSSDHTTGTPRVTDLGVVGRGVKRVLTTPASASGESCPAKKPAIDAEADSNAS
ncbi:hypothetical protein Nepgr_025941 [Nepenthes gracilis]|uniref:Uncharacterized protein n=1 Tax=Nepenthes gracilis TaxID=150966 RepID=A0AAD3T766_NEPGR|nr:hypothetical protein Nepgr_025941 [Nepenthes gracilis]